MILSKKNLSRQKCQLLVFMINSKHVYFYWGVLYFLDPPIHIFGGSGPPRPPPPPPPPPRIDAPASKGPFRFSSQPATCPYVVEASHCPFNTSSREPVNTNFSSLWFDPTVNRARVYCFSSRRSIYTTTDRFMV